MSFHDFKQREIHYTATSRAPVAPSAMAHPGAGPFQLVTFSLFETHCGPMRRNDHHHDVYHLVIFEEADNQMLLNGAGVATHRGLCVLTHPQDSHCFLPGEPGHTAYHALTFQFADMRHAPPLGAVLTHLTGIPLPSLPRLFTIPERGMTRLPAQLAELRASLPLRTQTDSAQLHHAILGLLLFIAREVKAQEQPTGTSAHNPATRARNYLDAHYTQRLSMKELASQAGVSPAHLGRCFQQRYGISPGRYRDTLRMEAAANLLRHSDLQIKTIAYELGYPDSSTFSKAFRRHTHSSPQVYRQQSDLRLRPCRVSLGCSLSTQVSIRQQGASHALVKGAVSEFNDIRRQ